MRQAAKKIGLQTRLLDRYNANLAPARALNVVVAAFDLKAASRGFGAQPPMPDAVHSHRCRVAWHGIERNVLAIRQSHLLSEIFGKCDPKRRLFLALRPPKLSRSSTEHITEMTR